MYVVYNSIVFTTNIPEESWHTPTAAGAVEGRRTALPEEMQGHAAGLDLAPATRSRRAPKPVERLVER